jgi:hypothetical protein
MTIKEADNLMTKMSPTIKNKRFYLNNEGAKRTFVITALTIKEIGLKDFQVFAIINTENHEKDLWEVNVSSLQLFFTQL